MPHDSDVWAPPEGGGVGVSEHQPTAFQLRFQNKAVLVGKDGSNAQLAASSAQWASVGSKGGATKAPVSSAHLTGMKRAMMVNHPQRTRGGGAGGLPHGGRGGGAVFAPPSALQSASPRDAVPESGMGAAIKKFGFMTPAQERRQQEKLIAAQMMASAPPPPALPLPPKGLAYAPHPGRIEPSRVDVGLDYIPNEHGAAEASPYPHHRGLGGPRGAHLASSPPSSSRSPSSSQHYLGAMEDHIQHIKKALNPTHVAKSASPPPNRTLASAQSSSCGSFTQSPPRAERPPNSSPAPPRMHGQARKLGPPGQRLAPLDRAGPPNTRANPEAFEPSGVRVKEAWLPDYAETASDVEELDDSTIVIEACEEVVPPSAPELAGKKKTDTTDDGGVGHRNSKVGPPKQDKKNAAPREKQQTAVASKNFSSGVSRGGPTAEKEKNNPQAELRRPEERRNSKPLVKTGKPTLEKTVSSKSIQDSGNKKSMRGSPDQPSRGPATRTNSTRRRPVVEDDLEEEEESDEEGSDEDDDTGEEKNKRSRSRNRNRHLGEKGKFVPYSVDEYRSMMKEVRQQKLGGLGPSDTDAQRAAREKLEKQKSYGARVERETLLALEKARLQQERNKNTEASEMTGTCANEDGEEGGADSKHTTPQRAMQRDADGHLIIAQPTPPEIIEARQRRERAKQYAMKVPRPQVKTRPPPLNNAEESALDGLLQEAHMKGPTSPRGQIAQQRAQRLADLEAKHQLYQKNVDHIRKQLRA